MSRSSRSSRSSPSSRSSRPSSRSRQESSGQQSELFQLMLQVSEGDAPQESVAEVMRRIDAVIDQDVESEDPERVREASRRLVDLYVNRGAAVAERPSPRRRSGRQKKPSAKATKLAKLAKLTTLIDATQLREAEAERLRCDLAALRLMRHENLLNVDSFSAMKGRFVVGLDAASAGHTTLKELFDEATPLNGCEIACVVAQAARGLLFLQELLPASAVAPPTPLRAAASLRPESVVVCSSGLVKLAAYHPAVRPPADSPPASCDCGAADFEADDAGGGAEAPGLAAERMALLLYQMDHDAHCALPCSQDCSHGDRQRLDDRYSRLFSLCADWPRHEFMNWRRVLFSEFVNQQTSGLNDFCTPLQLVLAGMQ